MIMETIIPNLSYVKEEGADPLAAASRIIESAGDDILGVMEHGFLNVFIAAIGISIADTYTPK